MLVCYTFAESDNYKKWRDNSTPAEQRAMIANDPEFEKLFQSLPQRVRQLHETLSARLSMDPNAVVNVDELAGTIRVSSLYPDFLKGLPVDCLGFQRSWPADLRVVNRPYITGAGPITCKQAGYLIVRVGSLHAHDHATVKSHFLGCRDCYPEADRATFDDEWHAVRKFILAATAAIPL